MNGDAGYSSRAIFAVGKDGRIVHQDVSANPGDPEQLPSLERLTEALRRLPR